MPYTTGMFAFALTKWDGEFATAGYATCEIDLFDQILVCFTYIVAEQQHGALLDDWGDTASYLYLHFDRFRECIELHEVLDRESSLLQTWQPQDFDDDLRDEFLNATIYGNSDAREAFHVLRIMTSDYITVEPLVEDTIFELFQAQALDFYGSLPDGDDWRVAALKDLIARLGIHTFPPREEEEE